MVSLFPASPQTYTVKARKVSFALICPLWGRFSQLISLGSFNCNQLVHVVSRSYSSDMISSCRLPADLCSRLTPNSTEFHLAHSFAMKNTFLDRSFKRKSQSSVAHSETFCLKGQVWTCSKNKPEKVTATKPFFLAKNAYAP